MFPGNNSKKSVLSISSIVSEDGEDSRSHRGGGEPADLKIRDLNPPPSDLHLQRQQNPHQPQYLHHTAEQKEKSPPVLMPTNQVHYQQYYSVQHAQHPHPHPHPHAHPHPHPHPHQPQLQQQHPQQATTHQPIIYTTYPPQVAHHTTHIPGVYGPNTHVHVASIQTATAQKQQSAPPPANSQSVPTSAQKQVRLPSISPEVRPIASRSPSGTYSSIYRSPPTASPTSSTSSQTNINSTVFKNETSASQLSNNLQDSKGMISKFRMQAHFSENSNGIKHRNSCTRCRKLKKGCDKSDPECYNCKKFGLTCVYVPRKQRRRKDTTSKLNNTTTGEEHDDDSETKSSEGRTTVIENGNSPPDDQMVGVESNNFKDRFSKKTLVSLFDAFYISTFGMYPIISKKQLDAVDLTDIESSEISFELYMIFMLGYQYLQRMGDVPKNGTAEHFLSLAKSVKLDLEVPSIANVRRLFLLAMLENTTPSGHPWEPMDALAKMVIKLDAGKLENCAKMSSDEVDEVKRTVWSAFIFEGHLTISRGRTPLISEDAIDIPFPDEADDEWISNVQCRRLLGEIWAQVHTEDAAAKRKQSADPDQYVVDTLSTLKTKIDEWYTNARKLIHRCHGGSSHAMRLRENTDKYVGGAARYIRRCCFLESMLYRPSKLNPRPKPAQLEFLKSAVNHTALIAHNLSVVDHVTFSQMALNIVLSLCLSLMYLLKEKYVTASEAKNEVWYLTEVFDIFSEGNKVAEECGAIFHELDDFIINSNIQDETLDSFVEFIEEVYQRFAETLSKYLLDIAP